jgi:hypothetical protein
MPFVIGPRVPPAISHNCLDYALDNIRHGQSAMHREAVSDKRGVVEERKEHFDHVLEPRDLTATLHEAAFSLDISDNASALGIRATSSEGSLGIDSVYLLL